MVSRLSVYTKRFIHYEHSYRLLSWNFLILFNASLMPLYEHLLTKNHGYLIKWIDVRFLRSVLTQIISISIYFVSISWTLYYIFHHSNTGLYPGDCVSKGLNFKNMIIIIPEVNLCSLWLDLYIYLFYLHQLIGTKNIKQLRIFYRSLLIPELSIHSIGINEVGTRLKCHLVRAK